MSSIKGGHGAFTPDGRSVLVTADNGTLMLEDAAGGTLLRTFANAAQSYGGTFLPHGRGVVGFGSDGSLRIWKTETGEILTSMYTSPDGEWVTVTPEGFFDASEHGADILGVVNGLQVSSLDQLYQALHRPDLVAEKLAGDPQGKVAAAAAKLDLGKVAASGGAPRVSLLTPADGTTTEADHIDIEARIDDSGGGVGRIEWRINGAVLGVEERSLERLTDATQLDRSVAAHRRVSLADGDNVIEVVAYNAQNLAASTPVRIKVTSTQPRLGKPKLYVLAVRVNNYWDSRINLSYAAPDATAFAQALKQAGGTLYDAVDTTTVLDADATAANLDKVFAGLAAKIQPQDVFVFFYAGHGKTIDARFYMLPQDLRYAGDASVVAQGIGQDQFQKWLAAIPARKSMLLFDACESGSLTAEATRGLGRIEEQYTALDRMTQATGRTILTASTDDKPALEGYKGHGVFTYALLDGLARAQAHADGLIYMNELVSFVEDDVPDISFKAFNTRQIPQTKTVGTNFPLVRRTSVLVDGGAEALPRPDVAAKPASYVVIAPVAVRLAADPTSSVTRSLPAGSQVDLVQTNGGWSLVARAGKSLGYVDAKALLRLQYHSALGQIEELVQTGLQARRL